MTLISNILSPDAHARMQFTRNIFNRRDRRGRERTANKLVLCIWHLICCQDILYLGKIEYNKVYIVIKHIIIEYMNVIWSLMCKNDLTVTLMI